MRINLDIVINESKHVSASLPNAGVQGVGLALLSFKRVAEPCGKPLAEPFNVSVR